MTDQTPADRIHRLQARAEEMADKARARTDLPTSWWCATCEVELFSQAGADRHVAADHGRAHRIELKFACAHRYPDRPGPGPDPAAW